MIFLGPAIADADFGAPASPRGAAAPELVRRAIAFLESRSGDPVTLRELETATAGNRHRIIRAFRRHLGITPHAYIMRLQVRRALALLAEGERIVDAAAEAGFADQSHFTKHFKRVCGMTPGKYLRLNGLRGAAPSARAGAKPTRPLPAQSASSLSVRYSV